MTNHIPKRIIQTGKQVQQPLFNQAVVSNLRLLNPDFEYLFFDDQGVRQFIADNFPGNLQVFDSFRFRIQKYDFFRYLAVYHFGGFYFDLDVLLARGVSELLQTGCVFPFEGLTFSGYLRNRYGIDWEIGNYAFGASTANPFLGAVIDNCVRAQRDRDWLKPMMHGLPRLSKGDFLVLNSTGPGLLTRTFAERPELSKYVTVLFPDNVCDFGNWNRFGDFGIHCMQGSWRSRGGYLRSRLAQKFENWKLRTLLRRSARVGPKRYHAVDAC